MDVVVKAGNNQGVIRLFCGGVSQEGANSGNVAGVKAASCMASLS